MGTGNDRPNREPTALGRIGRSVYALLTYRCDAHRAAWRVHNISGPAWETFAQIVGGQVTSPELYVCLVATAAGAAWLHSRRLCRIYG